MTGLEERLARPIDPTTLTADRLCLAFRLAGLVPARCALLSTTTGTGGLAAALALEVMRAKPVDLDRAAWDHPSLLHAIAAITGLPLETVLTLHEGWQATNRPTAKAPTLPLWEAARRAARLCGLG